MPSLQVVNTTRDKPDPTELEQFFSKLGKDYRDKQDKADVNKLLNEYQQNRKDANAWEDLQLGLEKSTVSPTKRLEVQKSLNEMAKVINEKDKTLNARVKQDMEGVEKKKETERVQQSVFELYKPWMGEEEAKRLSTIDNEATARSKVAQLAKVEKPGAQSQFEKTVQAEEAKKLVKLEEDIPKARDALANLDRIEDLAKNELSGVKGYLKSAIGTEAAAEMKNLSFTAIEPIIKLFNPVGPIPVQKVKIIQQQFQAYPSDLQSTIKGKVAALRRIGEQALARAEQRVALIRKYKGSPPAEELQEFDKASSQLQDTLVDQEAFNLKMKDSKEDELVEGFYSAKDGRKLKPIPKKEAKKLYEQGLITNVPPS